MNALGLLDLFYMDESRVSMQPVVPYAWQFRDEEVWMPSDTGGGLNCLAMISRDHQCHFATTTGSINGAFLEEQLDALSLQVQNVTVVVLDNAPAHRAWCVKRRRAVWQERGLFLFYLPVYSPHLNLAETLWRHLKHLWLTPHDYLHEQTLFYQTRQALSAVGSLLHIHFAPPLLHIT